jgi:hypothetical protein
MWIMKHANKVIALAIALPAILVILALSVRPALAHSRVEFGPYVIIVGWETEPVIVGERNALFLDVSKSGTPVEGLEGTLGITISYGGQTFTGNLQPGAAPGTYHSEILPTVRGQYSVHLAGMVEDLEINETVEPEEVLSAAVLQFPESPPDGRELQASIDELTSQLQTTRILALTGLALAIGGIVLAAFSLTENRH